MRKVEKKGEEEMGKKKEKKETERLESNTLIEPFHFGSL